VRPCLASTILLDSSRSLGNIGFKQQVGAARRPACAAGAQDSKDYQEIPGLMSQQLDSSHGETRGVLRVLGPAVAVVGLILTIVGFASFFSAFGSGGPPGQFWCAFLGLPLLGVGLGICKFAYLGAVSRYVAGEVAPVSKDVVNYLAEGTKGAVRDLAAAVGEGLHAGVPSGEIGLSRCHKCNAENEASANFCKACGAPLAKTRPCDGCGELNDPDARFCDNCGKPIA
jgi:hypothetical protein